MPSPFPGMDPYLEAPDIWADLHHSLACKIQSALNASLPTTFYARLGARREISSLEEGDGSQGIFPDPVVIYHSQAASEDASPEVPRRAVSPSIAISFPSEQRRHLFVEIRDASRGHELVTLIEIASPTNKRKGPDRKAYLKKQQEILESDATLIELDLLRTGERLFPDPRLEGAVDKLEPAPDYIVLVNRGWARVGDATDYQIFPIPMAEQLPCIPVPLRKEIEEVPLDLQFVLQQAYDTGPYLRGAVDYARPPDVAVEPDRLAWIEQQLRATGLRAAEPA